MPADLHADAQRQLLAWRPEESAQRALREATLGLLEARADACSRSCTPGHLTASAVVLDEKGRHACLVHHRLVGRWLQPGGHLEESDATLAAAALREVHEETSLEQLTVHPEPLCIDVHPITCRGSGPTRHFDIRFLVVAGDQQPTVSEESFDVRWFDVDALPDTFDEVHETIALARHRLAALAPTAASQEGFDA